MNNNSLNNCSNRNLNPSFGGSGTVNTIISSGGGNLTDDSSCSTYFTQTSDKTNLGTLNSSLGALSNNGGFVPTIPLLANSPAIDSGVTVAGMTQDARLAARPQGEAFDSGAYESPFSRPATTTLAVTGTDSLVLMIASIGLISTGASYLLLKLRQSRI
jgi:hypothetical protein